MHLIQNNLIKKLNISKKKIVLMIFIFIFTFFLLFSLIKTKQKTKKLIKIKYEDVMKEINAKKKLNFIFIEKFILENKNIYGTLTALSLAKQYILKNDLEKAFIQLKHSLKYTKEENLKNILRLRMSKIKIQQKKYKDAMQIIKQIKDESWKNIVEDIKGDIFMKIDNIKLAIKAWEKSKYFEESKTSKEIINMKINEIQIK